MAEVNEFGLPVYADPRDGFIAFPIARQDLDRLFIRRYEGMAAHAFLHGGYPGNI